MKKLNGNTRYLLAILLYEIFMFFINSFLYFPLHIKRIILCFVYSDDHQPTFVYPYLEEENLQPPYIVDVILYLHPSPLIRMSFVFKSFLSLIIHVTLRRLKLIQNFLGSQHLMPLLVSISINLLILMSKLLLFKLKSEISCLNL